MVSFLALHQGVLLTLNATASCNHLLSVVAGTTYKTWRHSTKAFEFAFRAEMLLFLNLSVSHHIQLHYGAASSLRVYNAHDDQQLLEVLLEFLNQPAEYGIARRMVQVQAKFEQPPPAEGSGRQQVTGRKRRKQADGAAPTAVGAGAGPAAAGQGGAAAESVEMGNDQQSETEEDHSEEQYPDNVVFDDLVAAAEEAYKQEVEQSKSIADELRSVKEQLLIEQVNNTTLRMTLTMLQNDLQREKDNSSTSGTRGCVSCTLLAS